MTLVHAFLLGAVQGLTEFLPVSSTAHLYLAQALLGVRNDEVALAFDIVLHLGTAMALILATWGALRRIVTEFFRLLSGKPALDPVGRALVLPLIVGTVPGALAGLFLLKRIEGVRTLGLIGLSMLVASVYFFVAEALAARQAGHERDLTKLDLGDAIWIGIAQAAAGLMAGFSRSGFTISTGRVRGLQREDSARFSFLLALPIILGAGGKALFDLHRTPEPGIGAGALAVGFLAAAAVGYFAVRFLLKFLRTHTLRPFGVYLGLLGAALLIASLARGTPLFATP